MGQVALGILRMGAVEVFGDDEAEHPVAEEFEALVITLVLLGGAVGERLGEQRLVAAAIAESL